MSTKTYARIAAGVVAELITLDAAIPVADAFHADIVSALVDVTAVTPQPQQGWQYAAGAFAPPPPPPAPTLAQQATIMLAAGCQITSASTPALDATYPVDAPTQQHVQAEVTSILLNGAFADGGATVAWPDVADDPRTFTVAQFKTFATALAAFVAGCLKVANGQSQTLPTQPSSIP